LNFSDIEGENAANESNDFVDFNALNTNNFSDEEELEHQAAAENDDFVNQNPSEDELGIDPQNPAAAYKYKDSLKNNNQGINYNNNATQDANLINECQEEKQKPQKSHTNRTNETDTNRTLEEKNKNSLRQNNKNNYNNGINKTKREEEQEDEEENENTKAKKAEILNFLLNSEIKPKATQKKEESAEHKQKAQQSAFNKSKKYQHVESNYKKEKLENDPAYKSGPGKFFINADFGNPEFQSNKQNAQRKLLLSTKNASESEKDKIIRKLLFQDIEKQKKIIEVDKLTNKDIKNKVSYYLNKKQKKIDEMESLNDEISMKNCTFKPEMIAEKLFPEKRDFKGFLEDQKNHLKRVHDKLEKVIFIVIYKIFHA
jgi:hypothetical protein